MKRNRQRSPRKPITSLVVVILCLALAITVVACDEAAPTPTQKVTAPDTASPTPTAVRPPIPTYTPSPVPLVFVPTPTPTPSPHASDALTATATPTLMPTDTEESEPTEAEGPISTPTPTQSPPTSTPGPIATSESTSTPTPTQSPTNTPTLGPTNTPTAVPTATPDARETANAALGEVLAWFGNPLDEHHAVAADAILEIWAQFPETALALAQFVWVVDGITEAEAGALVHIQHIASYDVALVAQLLSIGWVVDGVNEDEGGYLILLAGIDKNKEAAKQILRYQWVLDGIAVSEHDALEILLRVANAEPELAQAIANLDWIEDGFTEAERETLTYIGRIVDIDQSMALQLTQYRWLQNDIGHDQQETLHGLAELAGINPEIAYRVANAPWLRDAETVASHQWDAVYYLSVILRRDGWLGGIIVDLISNSLGQLERDLISALSFLQLEKSEAFARLRQQPWFADGLSRDEMAFLVTTRDIIEHSPGDFDEMIVSRYTQSKSINLPLSGDVNIWAIQKTPFPEGEDITVQIEEALLALEEITLTPLYVKDVVVLIVVHEPDSEFIFRGQLDVPWPGAGHAESHVRMPRDPQTKVIELNALFHELSHYQFNMFPGWLLEGGASFAGRFMWYRNVERSFEAWKAEVDPNSGPGCGNGAANLHELGTGGFGFQFEEYGICHYTMGEHFFASLFHTLGREVVSSGLRDIIAIPAEQDRTVTSKDIFLAFKNHVPPDQEQRYLELFRVLHGGPLVGDWSAIQDIEGDTPEMAFRIQTDALIQASLDHPFDVDYFTVSLAAGQTVLPRFESYFEFDPLGEELIVTWLLPSGVEPDFIPALSGDAASMQVEWVAPIAGEYIFRVQGASGALGHYDVNITSGDALPDQHGDTPDQSTAIAPGETLTGVMNSPTDRDVFRLDTVAGRVYTIAVRNTSLRYTILTIYESDGIKTVPLAEGQWGFDGANFSWTPDDSGPYFIEVSSDQGNIGAYNITVTENVLGGGDHGGDHTSATLLQLGQRVNASLDPAFDADYFKFGAEQGLAYNILFDHLTIGAQPVTILDSDGTTVIHKYEPWGIYEFNGTLIPWIAPRTGDYYIRCESPDGDTGDYTVVVLPGSAVADEHGDTPESAMAINLNEAVPGSLSEEYDFDYFKVDVQGGENYFIALDYGDVSPDESVPAPRIGLHVGDTLDKEINGVDYGLKRNGKYLNWRPSVDQTYYVVIWSAKGYVGQYTLIVETGASIAGSP